MLEGFGGDDTLTGYAGNDTLDGGAGNDTLNGGDGDDIYIFRTADALTSSDFVYEVAGEGSDSLRLHGVAAADVRMWSDGGFLFILLPDGAGGHVEAIRQSHDFSVTGIDLSDLVEQIVFDDGTVWSLTSGLRSVGTDDAQDMHGSALGDSFLGNSGGDTLNGYAGNDTLDGGAGGDFLNGGDGDDIYIFRTADALTGSDFVYEVAGEGSDSLRLHGVAAADVRMWSDGGFLFILLPDGAGGHVEAIRQSHDFSVTGIDLSDLIEQIVFDDGTVWSLTSGLRSVGTNDAQDMHGSALGDSFLGNGGGDTLNGYAGNDTLDGGAAATP